MAGSQKLTVHVNTLIDRTLKIYNLLTQTPNYKKKLSSKRLISLTDYVVLWCMLNIIHYL